MPPSIIDHDASLESVLDHNTTTLTRLLANPLTQQLAPPFQLLQDRLMDVQRQETLLWIDILKGTTRVSVADDVLDDFVDVLSNSLLAETGNDRDAAFYKLYFGKKRPSDLKRSVLGGQLETMRGWISSLQQHPSPAIQALGQRLAQDVQQADDAEKALEEARQRNREFRAVGERKALIDAANALRKSTYGALAELPHKHPEKNLSNTFAEHFFKRAPRKKASEEEPRTAADLAAHIAQVEEQLGVLKARYTDVLATEEAQARAKAQREADAAALADAEKEAHEALARVAALRAKLGA